MYVARISSFPANDQVVFFEGRRFNAFSFSNGDQSIDFMRWLEKRSLSPISEDEIEDPRVFAMLCRMGFISHDINDVAEDVAEKHNSCFDGLSNASVHLIVAQYCNLKCSYCYNGEDSYKLAKKPRMSKDTAEQAVRIFMRYLDSKHGNLSINFLGGEPLLGWSVIEYVLENMDDWASEEGFMGRIFTSLQTNLSFLPTSFIEVVRRHRVRILVEIDGPKAVHDDVRGHKVRAISSFDATQKNCKEIKSAGIEFDCKAVLTSKNITKLVEVKETHMNLGARSSSFSELRPVNSDGHSVNIEALPNLHQISEALNSHFVDKDEDTPLMAQTKSKACANMLRSASRNTIGCHQKHAAIFSVTADGEIYNCPWFVQNADHFIGHVSDRCVDRGRAVANVRHLSTQPDEVCRKCAYFGGCGGGCPVTRELSKGDTGLVDYVRNIRCATYIPAIQSIILSRLRNQHVRPHRMRERPKPDRAVASAQGSYPGSH